MTTLHKKGFRLALLLTAALILGGCKKDGSSPDGKASTNALFSGTWKLKKYELLDGAGNWQQATPSSTISDEDLTFNADGTYEATSGGLHSYSDHWSTFDNGQSISIGAGLYAYDIVTLNSSTMVLVIPNETPFPYYVNGVLSTYHGERETYGH